MWRVVDGFGLVEPRSTETIWAGGTDERQACIICVHRTGSGGWGRVSRYKQHLHRIWDSKSLTYTYIRDCPVRIHSSLVYGYATDFMSSWIYVCLMTMRSPHSAIRSSWLWKTHCNPKRLVKLTYPNSAILISVVTVLKFAKRDHPSTHRQIPLLRRFLSLVAEKNLLQGSMLSCRGYSVLIERKKV